MPAGPSCAGSSDAPRLIFSASPHQQRHARLPLGLEPVVAPRSPTPTAGGSTPSEPAPVPSIQSGHLLLDNCRDIVVEASATWLRHGSVAPWGAAGCRPAVFRHRGFDSLPAHHARHASQVGHRALTPDKTGFETQGAHHAAVAQPARAAACEQKVTGSSPVGGATSTWPNGEGTGLRNRRVQVRPLPSTLSSP